MRRGVLTNRVRRANAVLFRGLETLREPIVEFRQIPKSLSSFLRVLGVVRGGPRDFPGVVVTLLRRRGRNRLVQLGVGFVLGLIFRR